MVTFYLSYNITPSRVTVTPIGYVNYRCTEDSQCANGLSCDSNLKLCKGNVGYKCTNAYSCVTGLYCLNTCKDPSVTPYCPCDYNSQVCVNGVCKSFAGCSQDSDCVSGVCNNGQCANRTYNGGSCTQNTDCISNNCSKGICQLPDQVTGNLTTYCNGNSDCNEGLSCINGTCQF